LGLWRVSVAPASLEEGATVEGPRAIQYRIARRCANGMAEGGGADMHVPLWADWHAVL